MDEITIANKRREYVNKRFGKLNKGKSFNQKQKTKLFKKLWKEAKKKYK